MNFSAMIFLHWFGQFLAEMSFICFGRLIFFTFFTNHKLAKEGRRSIINKDIRSAAVHKREKILKVVKPL